MVKLGVAGNWFLPQGAKRGAKKKRRFKRMFLFLQVGAGGDRSEREHAGGHPQRQGALRRAGTQEVAV